MSDTQLEIGIVQKVMNFLDITESIDNVQLYETLIKFRNQMHPDQCYDEESKKIASKKFVKANQLLTDLNSYINRDRLTKPTNELVALEKDYQIVNTQQKVLDKEKENEKLNQIILKYRTIIKQLLEQNKVLSRDKKEANYDEIRQIYKTNGKIKLSIGLKVAFVLVYSFISSIDQVITAMQKFIPFSANVVNLVVFIIIILSIVHSIWKIIQNSIIENNSKRIETTTLISKFSKLIENDHRGSKISENKIFEFIKDEFSSKHKLKRIFEWFFQVRNDIVIEKYKNIFINSLLEKQLIKISKAKSLDREFYVFGSSWSERMNEKPEINTELVNDDDIDSLIDEIE